MSPTGRAAGLTTPSPIRFRESLVAPGGQPRLETVKDQVQTELELDIVIATAQAPLVAGRHCELREVRKVHSHRPGLVCRDFRL